MHSLQLAPQLSRRPSPSALVQWGRGALREGATLSLSETDGRCRQKCRSPSPRETPRRRGSRWAPRWEFGAATAKPPPTAPTDLFLNAHAATPQSCTPEHFHTGLPSITSFLHTSSLRAPTPLRAPLLRGGKGLGGGSPHLPCPGTTGPGLACEGGGEGEAAP